MPLMTPWLWAVFTIIAAASQTLRNATQRDLTLRLGTVGATHVRFLFGLPFAVLFLVLVLLATDDGLPRISASFLTWTAFGACAQIGATASMLATMKSKSFVVTTAYTKTEPVQVAIFGFVVLGDRLSPLTALAIAIATLGVMCLSWPGKSSSETPAAMAGEPASASWMPAVLGLGAGALFALSAIGFRAAIRGLETGSFVLAASTTLVAGLLIQALSLTAYLIVFRRHVLTEIMRAWRPSMLAGFAGALASQFWFLAFAIETAARVRTLALIEIFFAQMISGRLFKERSSIRELAGLVLIAIGCALIIGS